MTLSYTNVFLASYMHDVIVYSSLIVIDLQNNYMPSYVIVAGFSWCGKKLCIHVRRCISLYRLTFTVQGLSWFAIRINFWPTSLYGFTLGIGTGGARRAMPPRFYNCSIGIRFLPYTNQPC